MNSEHKPISFDEIEKAWQTMVKKEEQDWGSFWSHLMKEVDENGH